MPKSRLILLGDMALGFLRALKLKSNIKELVMAQERENILINYKAYYFADFDTV